MGFFCFLFAYGAGLFAAPYLPCSSRLIFVPPLIASVWFVLRVARRRGDWLLPGFFFTLALILYHINVTPPKGPSQICAFVGSRPVIVEGTVTSVSDRSFGRSAIDIETRRAGSRGILAPVHGRLRLYLDEPAPEVVPGQTIRFYSRLRLPRRFGTPGEFDYPRHLAFQGIFTTAHLSRTRGIAIFPRPQEFNISAIIETRQRAVGRFIDSHIEPATAPLVKALLIGDKGGITPQQRQLLSRGGISHLFAISGLHFALIAFFLFVAARFFYRRSETLLLLAPPGRILPVAILPLLLVYLDFTGSALPTRRAFFMAAVGVFLLLFRRRTRPVRLLAATAFLLLLIKPLAFFEPSFQLSFAGVLGLLVFLPRWQEKLPSRPALLRWGATLMAATLAATLATAPLVLLHFHMAAPAALLSNLLAVPAVGLAAMPLGLAGVLLIPLSSRGAAFLMKGCAFILRTVLQFVSRMIRLPGLGGWTFFGSPLQLTGIFLVCWGLFIPGGSSRRRFARLLLPLLGAVLFFLPPLPSSKLTVTSLSVGQGDSILVSRPGDRNYLVDGGGLYSDTFDVGERLVAPALGWMGVHSLEAVILTHDHPDHRKGLVYVLAHFPVKAFWSAIPTERLHPSLREVLRRRKIPVVVFPRGWTTLEKGKENSLAVFIPHQEGSNLNDDSLVLYTRLGRAGVLLTGDLESRGVEELLSSASLPPVSLLKLPHHGSRNSDPGKLLDALHPRMVFVSAGRGNIYHFPHREVVNDIRRRAIPLFRTDLQGTIRFSTEGGPWRAKHWQAGLFH